MQNGSRTDRTAMRVCALLATAGVCVCVCVCLSVCVCVCVCSKRITLGAIYMSAELYMLTDYSEDFMDTRDFVRRQVTDAETAGSPLSFAMKHVSAVRVCAEGVVIIINTLPSVVIIYPYVHRHHIHMSVCTQGTYGYMMTTHACCHCCVQRVCVCVYVCVCMCVCITHARAQSKRLRRVQ